MLHPHLSVAEICGLMALWALWDTMGTRWGSEAEAAELHGVNVVAFYLYQGGLCILFFKGAEKHKTRCCEAQALL